MNSMKNSSKNKAIPFLALLLVSSLLLSGCSSLPKTEKVSVTLPPPISPYSPDQQGENYVEKVKLFLPAASTNNIEAFETSIALAEGVHPAETTLRKLLSFSGNETSLPLEKSVSLSLLSSLEISAGVATVNLTPSVLNLDTAQRNKVCQSIANTLCQFPDIQYVNILAAYKALPSGGENNLPMGLLQYSDNYGLNADDEKGKAFSRLVSIYLPAALGKGIVAKAKKVSFSSRETKYIAETLLALLSESSSAAGDMPNIPPLNSLLSRDITLSEPHPSIGKVIHLDFKKEANERFIDAAIPRSLMIAAISMTISSFIPEIAGIKVNIDREQIHSLSPSSLTQLSNAEIIFENSVISRKYFDSFVLNPVTLFLPNESGGLDEVQMLLPHASSANPEYILNEILKTNSEDKKEIFPASTKNANKKSILSVARKGETMLVNLNESFILSISHLDQAKEKQLIYAMVNSLCQLHRIKRVRFFVNGKQLNTFSGYLFTSGEFLFNPDI